MLAVKASPAWVAATEVTVPTNSSFDVIVKTPPVKVTPVVPAPTHLTVSPVVTVSVVTLSLATQFP